MPDDELVVLVRDGDTEALDVLLHRYTSYARAKAKTYFLIGADREDIIQEGMIGLFKAIRDFDPARPASFRSFAELCITRQIITAIKGATRHKHAPLNSYVSIHRPLSADEDDSERQLVDFLASAKVVDPVEQIVAEDEVVRIREFLAEILSELEVDVLNQYLEGRSYQEIATTLRRQAKSIDNALQRIKRKLETFLSQRENAAAAADVASGRQSLADAVTPAAHPAPVHMGTYRAPAAIVQPPAKPLRRLDVVRTATNGTRASKAAALAENGASEPKPRTAARSGDLRAGLRMATAVAARKGAKVTRTAKHGTTKTTKGR